MAEIISEAENTVDRLEKLGFTAASTKVKEAQKLQRKLAVAYEFYRFVKQEKIDKFNEDLRLKTWNKSQYTYQVLIFQSITEYEKVPPAHVLASLELAQERRCFDAYEVAHIVSKQEIPDPILFGRIDGCPDRFFIDQWDNDVKIEDLLTANEG